MAAPLPLNPVVRNLQDSDYATFTFTPFLGVNVTGECNAFLVRSPYPTISLRYPQGGSGWQSVSVGLNTLWIYRVAEEKGYDPTGVLRSVLAIATEPGEYAIDVRASLNTVYQRDYHDPLTFVSCAGILDGGVSITNYSTQGRVEAYDEVEWVTFMKGSPWHTEVTAATRERALVMVSDGRVLLNNRFGETHTTVFTPGEFDKSTLTIVPVYMNAQKTHNYFLAVGRRATDSTVVLSSVKGDDVHKAVVLSLDVVESKTVPPITDWFAPMPVATNGAYNNMYVWCNGGTFLLTIPPSVAASVDGSPDFYKLRTSTHTAPDGVTIESIVAPGATGSNFIGYVQGGGYVVSDGTTGWTAWTPEVPSGGATFTRLAPYSNDEMIGVDEATGTLSHWLLDGESRMTELPLLNHLVKGDPVAAGVTYPTAGFAMVRKDSGGTYYVGNYRRGNNYRVTANVRAQRPGPEPTPTVAADTVEPELTSLGYGFLGGTAALIIVLVVVIVVLKGRRNK